MNCIPLSKDLPLINEDLLVYYVSHCAACLRLSHSTIKLYLCAIRSMYVSRRGQNPLLQSTGLPLYRLQNVLRGIRKSQSGHGPRLRLPITAAILSQLHQLLERGFFSSYLDTLLKAAFSLAFFGFLRCGEFTTTLGKFDPLHHLCYGDVSFLPGQGSPEMHLRLKASKTDPYRMGCTLRYFKTNATLCPVQTMLDYLQLRQSQPRTPHLTDPLFTLPDHTPLSRHTLVSMLRSLLLRLGYDPNLFAGHSFRKGAATSAAEAHLPDHLIKVMGRWSSDCYQRYIHTPMSLIKEAQHRLTSQV